MNRFHVDTISIFMARGVNKSRWLANYSDFGQNSARDLNELSLSLIEFAMKTRKLIQSILYIDF